MAKWRGREGRPAVDKGQEASREGPGRGEGRGLEQEGASQGREGPWGKLVAGTHGVWL